MLYNRCTGIYKFGNNTYPRCIICSSNLGHIFRGKKCILWAGKYGMWVWTGLKWFRIIFNCKHYRQGSTHCRFTQSYTRPNFTSRKTEYMLTSSSREYSWICSLVILVLFNIVWAICYLLTDLQNGWMIKWKEYGSGSELL